MTGAEYLLRTAVSNGVDTCFSNPGTTEMDLVAALDTTAGVRTILTLFEGVATGMADGYGRMLERPALTLLHLGVGLGNGLANLHNARRAKSPIVNLVGDHPTAHLPYNAPLTSDLVTLAKPMSDWVARPETAEGLGVAMVEALTRAQSPQSDISTIVTPMDVLHAPTELSPPTAPARTQRTVEPERIESARAALTSGESVALLLSGNALRENGLIAAHRVALATGARVLSECFPARLDRGAGLPRVERIPYFPDLVLERLQGIRYLVLAGARRPVSFFKYPDLPHEPIPDGCEVLELAGDSDDAAASLEALADLLDAPTRGIPLQEATRPVPPEGTLDTKTIGMAIGALLPEGAIIADESATSGGPTYFLTEGCAPHSTLYLTGGGIGMGLPLASGAAVACPDRPVVALQGDGGGMYTPQALWTQAREGLNVTTVIFSNRKYQILNVEFQRAGYTAPGAVARSQTSLTNPDIDWVSLAKGMGVPGSRPETAEAFYKALKEALAEPGPHLIEAVI